MQSYVRLSPFPTDSIRLLFHGFRSTFQRWNQPRPLIAFSSAAPIFATAILGIARLHAYTLACRMANVTVDISLEIKRINGIRPIPVAPSNLHLTRFFNSTRKHRFGINSVGSLINHPFRLQMLRRNCSGSFILYRFVKLGYSISKESIDTGNR